MAVPSYYRYCLNLQGYSSLSDEEKKRIDLAQRFKPAVCAALTLVGLVTQSAPLLFALAALGYWAALLPYHPVDLLYRFVVRPIFRGPDLGADPVPRRFACGMAATLLLAGAIAWQAGAGAVGTVIVAATLAAQLALVLADFCVGSFFYWLLVKGKVFRGA